MRDFYDVIQAFADGEPVAPAELDAALADPEGRAHLIDLMVLRKLVKSSTAAVMPVASGRTVRHPFRWLAAAAVVLTTASVGSYFLGERSSLSSGDVVPQTQTATPTPDASGQDSGATVPPPAPTKVIRFQPGVDWTERGGF